MSLTRQDLVAGTPLSAVPLIGLACAAIGMPMLLAYNLPPSSTFLNQAAALVGWGSWLTLLAMSLRGSCWIRSPGLLSLQCALGLLLLASLASPLWAGLPWGLALSHAALIAAAALAVQVGAAAQREGLGVPVFRALCIGLVVAGAANSVIGIIQVFAPSWTDGDWIAHTYVTGRAVGNMRQPNHLSSLLLWATVAVIWLGDGAVVRRWLSQALALVFVFVVVLSASRTGTLSVVLLAVWGLFDRRLSRATRVLLMLLPLAYGGFWLATSAWADYSHHVFGGEGRFTTKGDISSSRWGIWSNTLALIRLHPWLGVGFGEFNFAWTLTPFPGRPVAFFDHTHNLILQFAVELGLPLTAVVTALLLRALWHAARAARGQDPNGGPRPMTVARAAFAMVFLILVHSQLEYPLWYAYYLLPAAFAFGLCLIEAPTGAAPAPPAAVSGSRPLLIASMLLMIGGFGSVYDSARVVVIFAPPEGAASLGQRIADGRNSVFFAHQADYAAATTADHPADVMAAFRRATHMLLDARLMQAWARALNDAGEQQKARYVAQRLREFHNEAAEPFFAPCEAPPDPSQPPFQCVAPDAALGYEDFR